MGGARSMWKGTVSFGMVSFPVKLYTAASSEDVSFRQLHGDTVDDKGQATFCGTPIKMPKACPVHGELEADSIIKAYEYEPGKFVQITDDDLASLPLPSKDTVGIVGFVPADQVDPVYFEKSYYLAPDKGGQQAFNLVLRAMALTKLVAIASITVRKKEQLCALRVSRGVFMLHPLFYSNELRVELDQELPEVDEQQLQVAQALMGAMTAEFDPEQYTDKYQIALNELLEAKLSGKVIEVQAPKALPSAGLAAMLQASLEAVKALPPAPVEVKTKVAKKTKASV